VIKTARDNRKELTEQQVTLLQRSATSRAKIRLAQAVTSDQSMALSVWRSENFTDDLAALGVKSNATLEALDDIYSMTSRWEFRLRSRARRVEVYLGIMPTPCLPDFKFRSVDEFTVNDEFDKDEFEDAVTEHLIEAIPEDERKIFKLIYADYVKTCNGIKSELNEVLRPLIYRVDEEGKPIVDKDGKPVLRDNPGLIVDKWNAWKDKEVALEEKRADARQMLVAFKAAELQLNAANAPGPDLAGKFTEAVEKLKTAVQAFDVICETGATLASLAPGSTGTSEKDGRPFSNSIICGKKRQALGQLIEAVATGQDPTAADAPRSLKNAAIIAAALPGLVGDVGATLEAGRKVPLARLRLLRAQASIDQEFAERKVERQEARVRQAMLAWRATIAEAHHLWQTRFLLCQVTQTASGIDVEREGILCQTLKTVTRTDSNDPQERKIFEKCEYELGRWESVPFEISNEETGLPETISIPEFLPTGRTEAVPDCLLGKTIAEALSNTAAAGDIKDALAHYYLAAKSAKAAQEEADYRTIVIDGTEALDQDERALRLWAELIVVPVNSLASHYQGGLKPEVIANTIVTGAGLGAIAVGVD
jgi:hypothetical protein